MLEVTVMIVSGEVRLWILSSNHWSSTHQQSVTVSTPQFGATLTHFIHCCDETFRLLWWQHREYSEENDWIVITMKLLHLLLLCVLCSSARRRSKKNNERASLLGLTKQYSTFELPYKFSPNLIKIGKNYKYLIFLDWPCQCFNEQEMT